MNLFQDLRGKVLKKSQCTAFQCMYWAISVAQSLLEKEIMGSNPDHVYPNVYKVVPRTAPCLTIGI